MNKAKLYMLICISILVFSISGSLAWVIWRSTTNAIVKLEVCAPTITFVGDATINGENLSPTTSREKALKKDIRVKLNKLCQDGDSAIMNMYMTLDLLPKELQEDTFIYELYRGEELIISGNFKDKSEGETITLLENEVITDRELKYTLYIYIDGKRENPLTMSDKSFRFYLYGEGTDAIYEENYLRSNNVNVDSDSLFLNTDITRGEIESVKTVDNNIVPEGINKSFDISSKGDGSVMLWYEDSNNNNLYEVYMGSSSGLIKLNNGANLFRGFTNVTEIDLSKLDTSNATDMHYMFATCFSLISLDISNFNTSKVTDMNRMFYKCYLLTDLDLSNFDTSSVIKMPEMFIECSNLTNLDISNFNTEKVTTMYGMFNSCSRLVNLNISNFNTKNVTNMEAFFYACRSLTNLDISNFDTSNVTDMSNMFRGCSNLKELNVSNFITKEVTNMESMFQDCSLLTNLDLSSFDTGKVDNMYNMFSKCFNLVNIKLNSFNTKNVNNMSYMFDSCSSLTSLNLSSFDTYNVTNTVCMFRSCTNLKEIDFRNADFSNVTSYNNMFASVSTSSHVYVKDSIQRDWLLERFPKFENIVVV